MRKLFDQIIDDWFGIIIHRPEVELKGFAPSIGCPWCGCTLDPMGCECGQKRIHWARLIRLGIYEPPLSSCIVQGKYLAWDVILTHLGKMLGKQIKGRVPPDSIMTPIPMPFVRKLFRRINHAQVISVAASKQAGLQHRKVLWRRDGIPQAGQTASQRLRLSRNSMSIRPLSRVKGKNIILVDDVMTTGKTLEIAANKLKEAGVLSVRVAVLAVTEKPRKGHKM